MHLDIASFSHRSEEDGAIVFRWTEPRDIHYIELKYQDQKSVPKPLDVGIEYWQDKWPASRHTKEDLAPGRAGRAAWKPQDDWFNGSWKKADIRMSHEDTKLVISFAPLADYEFPELSDFNVSFRRALKLRICLPRSMTKPPKVRILTDTQVEERRICVELGCGKESRPIWDGHVEVYNGFLRDLEEPRPNDPRLRLMILCSQPETFSNDGTIVSISSSAANFSFRPDDLSEGKPLWAPDLGALVSLADDDIVYSPTIVEELKTGTSVYDGIAKMPEQELSRALKDHPPKRPMHFIVGIEGRRQKFGIEPNGDLFAGIGFIRRVPGPDTAKISWVGGRKYIHFNWDDMTPNGRFLDEGYLPIHRATFSRGALDITQEVLATRLDAAIHSEPILGEDPVVAMVKITYRNRGDEPVDFEQRFGSSSGDPLETEKLTLQGGLVYACERGHRLRMAVDIGGKGKLSISDKELVYNISLRDFAIHTISIKVPFIDILDGDEMDCLIQKNWDDEYREVKDYWKSRVSEGTEIHTGQRDIDDFHRALITHILINDDHEVGSDRIIGRVSSFNYGNFSNEAIMQILELDRRGYHEEARRHLDTYLHYQGTVGLPGNFSTKEGVFYGSGGYEAGEYNQHHGWVLYGLAEHFRYTGDVDWLRSVAEGLIAGCDWVIRERRGTMVEDGEERSLEYGWMPAGALEDVKDFWYWVTTNCLTYRGLAAAAEVLEMIGHSDGTRLSSEAHNYKEDLMAGIRESILRSPLVRLKDGTYIPHLPSRIHWRGRDIGWIREVLEGSITATTTVLDPEDPISTWILKDFEDNRYLDAPWNYPLDDFEAQWFSLGGFSMQPNLVYTISPYIPRDQIKRFLRAFFNAFAACWRREIRCMTEHPLPTLADWTGDHFKSSDESNVAHALRLMFVQEMGKELHLGRALPRSWLRPGAEIWIRSAWTYFGEVSLEITVSPDARTMTAIINPPTRSKPDRILLRLRHPMARRMKRVLVDGSHWMEVDPDREWVVLPPIEKETTVEVEFCEEAIEAD